MNIKDINSKEGKIEVITGCMFSGKTEELLRKKRRAEIAGANIQAFTPKIDSRYGISTIGSHDGRKIEAIVVKTGKNNNMLELTKKETDVIIIDEANFFTEKLVEIVLELANNGYLIYISGLDQDFRGEPFDPVPNLMAVAEDVQKLKAICEKCGTSASKTQRLIDSDPAPYDSPTIEVGGSESYQARCRECHEVPK